jgi:hypothetical protein
MNDLFTGAGGNDLIFTAKNENGEYTWKLVDSGKKKTTSRVKPVAVGKMVAIQPGRGKRAVCKKKVISCMNRLEHSHQAMAQPEFNLIAWKQKEAELEGFLTWDGLMRYFQDHKLNFMELYRIEFDGGVTNG